MMMMMMMMMMKKKIQNYRLILIRNKMKKKPFFKIVIKDVRNNNILEKIGVLCIYPLKKKKIYFNVKKFLYWYLKGLNPNLLSLELLTLLKKNN